MVSLVQWNTNEDIAEEELWQKVYQYKDASGECAFEELALIVIVCSIDVILASEQC